MAEPFTLDWTRQLGSSGIDFAKSVAIDSNNNVYITGYTNGALDGTNAGSNDAFLAKYNSAGAIQWTKQLGSSASDVAHSVAIDSNNNVYITGYTIGTLPLPNANANAGGYDAFLAKYDSIGTNVWTKQLGTSANDIARSVAIDSNNNVYITGQTFGSLDGTNAGNTDAFLAKYDSNGIRDINWTKQLGTSGNDVALSVAIDSNNDVYITGYTNGALSGANAGINSNDAFLAKYNSTGAHQWTKQLGTYFSDTAYSVAIDSNNNVYIAGSTGGTLDVGNANANPSTNDAFLAKYDSTGNNSWTRQLGTSGSDVANGVAIDSNNNVYITGSTGGALGGDHVGGYDAFLAMYDSTGDIQWTKQLGTSDADGANGVAIDSNNNVYITGYTRGTLDASNANADEEDAFLAKYVPPIAKLDAGVINTIESSVPTVNTNDPIIVVDNLLPVGVLTSGSAIEKSQKRTTFLAKLFTDNAGLASATGKITMTKEKLLGTGSVITKDTMVIVKALNTDVPQDTSQLATNEGIYVYMNNGDFTVFTTSAGKLKITKTMESLYTIYENYVDNTSAITKTMAVGESSYLGTFEYVVGGVSGQITTTTPTTTPPAPICFPKGTPVVTNQGLVAIEKLNPDIHTIRGKKIVAITQSRPLFTHIVSIGTDALGKNVPSAPTQISKEHCVFYKGKMMRAIDLVGVCDGVVKIPYNGETLYNVLLKKHDKMMINNIVCETLHPDNIMAKICNGKYTSAERDNIYEELTNIIKSNNLPAYKKLYASLK